MTRVVQQIKAPPRFLIAKGGITASTIGVSGLNNKRAVVRGQCLPGVPVWQTGAESRFPNMPFIIFPGNVGDDDALTALFERLQK